MLFTQYVENLQKKITFLVNQFFCAVNAMHNCFLNH